jgi:hypothetical protein
MFVEFLMSGFLTPVSINPEHVAAIFQNKDNRDATIIVPVSGKEIYVDMKYQDVVGKLSNLKKVT